MKLFLSILAIVLVVGSFIADYKWRQWIAARKHERDQQNHPDHKH